MKELPKGALTIILLIGLFMLGFLVWQIRHNDNMSPSDQYLDELNIQTDNPQPAGQNIAP